MEIWNCSECSDPPLLAERSEVPIYSCMGEESEVSGPQNMIRKDRKVSTYHWQIYRRPVKANWANPAPTSKPANERIFRCLEAANFWYIVTQELLTCRPGTCLVLSPLAIGAKLVKSWKFCIELKLKGQH